MRFHQNIMAVGNCGGLLLLVSADKEDAKAATIEYNPESSSGNIAIGELYDTVQKPLKFNPFEPLSTEAGKNYLLLLDQRLSAEEVKRLNDHLAG